MFACFISQLEPKSVEDDLGDFNWIEAMQEKLDQFERNQVWELVSKLTYQNMIGIKWIFLK